MVQTGHLYRIGEIGVREPTTEELDQHIKLVYEYLARHPNEGWLDYYRAYPETEWIKAFAYLRVGAKFPVPAKAPVYHRHSMITYLSLPTSMRIGESTTPETQHKSRISVERTPYVAALSVIQPDMSVIVLEREAGEYKTIEDIDVLGRRDFTAEQVGKHTFVTEVRIVGRNVDIYVWEGQLTVTDEVEAPPEVPPEIPPEVPPIRPISPLKIVAALGAVGLTLYGLMKWSGGEK